MSMYASELIRLLRQAVERCTKDAKSVGLFLSGGLDSSVIQAIGRFDRLYCCSWSDEDNLTAAKAAAFGRYVTVISFSREEMLAALPEVARLTSGTGSWSQVCQYLMARQAKRDGCDVVLTGESSDELFGGYARYRSLYWRDRARYDKHLMAYRELDNLTLGQPSEALCRLLSRKGGACPIDRDPPSLVKAAAYHDLTVGLPPLLKNETAMIEAHGLKARYPYADPDIREFALALPPEQMVNDAENKHVLREAARWLGVSRVITDEVTKKGLFVPQSWRPEGEPLWSTEWFDRLMREAHSGLAA